MPSIWIILLQVFGFAAASVLFFCWLLPLGSKLKPTVLPAVALRRALWALIAIISAPFFIQGFPGSFHFDFIQISLLILAGLGFQRIINLIEGPTVIFVGDEFEEMMRKSAKELGLELQVLPRRRVCFIEPSSKAEIHATHYNSCVTFRRLKGADLELQNKIVAAMVGGKP